MGNAEREKSASERDTLERARLILETRRTEARQLVPDADLLLSDDTQFIYGTASAGDLTSERGLIAYALRFANGEEDDSARQRGAANLPVIPSLGRPGSLSEQQEEIEARRTKLRRTLTRLCHYRARGDRIKVQDAGSEYFLRGVWALPALRQEPNLHLAPFWIITSASAFDAFLAVLLLDEKRPFGRDLCRCRLGSCPQFFLKYTPEGGGRPRTRYCSDACMREANAATAGARSAASREGVSMKVWRERQKRRTHK